ncbi:hypothetical protein Tco_0133060 [Tanacetum coccineum]
MEISIADQIALDDALVAPANRLKIGKCNLRLSSDVTSKEATLQVVYDVLKLTPFYKAFQVSADVPEIYMQEFWASAYIHNRSVRFKMNNKKHILNLDQFRDILQICPKVGNKKFEEPPLEKEILAFLASLGHSGEIRKITDVNVNKLHQPWRSFAAIINKCLSGKPSYDSLRLSQAQILWGMYNNKKVDYAYLLWEDFTYQIENKNTKKGNAMYYPRFTKLVVNFVMDKDPSIPRRNKVNWHYARDDPMFTTINVISRNEDTQLYGTILPVALTNEDIRNSESYKEYYAIASGKIPPKTKASKKKADSDAPIKQNSPTVPKEKKGKKTGKGKQKAKDRSGADEGTSVSPGVPDAPNYDSDDDISWKSSKDDQDNDKNDDDENAQDDDDEAQSESEDDGDDFIHPKLTTHDDETTHEEETEEDDTFDPIVHTPSHVSSSDDEDSDNEVEGMDVEGEKSDEDATYVEDQGNEADRDTNANLEGRDDVQADVVLPQVQVTQEIEDTHVTLTLVNPDGQQQSYSVSSSFVSNMVNPNQDTGVDAIFGHNAEASSLVDIPVTTIVEPYFCAPTNRPPTPTPLFTQLQQTPILTPATIPSSSLQNLPDFGSLFGFDYRLKALEDNFSEFKQTNQYAEALSSIPGIVDQYLANKMKEAVDVAVQLKSDRIREEAQAENQQFLDSIDEGMKKVIKEQVKSEVSKITQKIEKLVNEQLKSEVLVRSSKEAKTSHAVAANLSELELKKILIDKMEANNSINRSDIQRQLYKALVDAYEADKILLDTYGDTVTIKRPRDGADDDQEPSAGTDRGSKRRRSGKEPESTSAPREKTTTTAGKTTTGSKTHKQSASQSAPVEETMQSTDVFEAPAHQEFETGVHDEQPKKEVHPLRLVSTPLIVYLLQIGMKSTKPQTRKIGLDHPEGQQVEWQNYKHIDGSHVRRDDDILYIVQRRMFTRSGCHLAWWKTFQLGVKAIKRNSNLTKPARQTQLREEVAYTPYSDPRGFIYENKDKKNRLMRIDELHKFSDGTLDDVRTALNDRLKGIRMEYLSQTFWSLRDKANARAMIQAIDKRLKTRRIMRSLERFVGGRPYGGDLLLLHGPYDLSYVVIIL